MRIIACGNRDRTDDSSGILVAERLRALGVQVEIQSGEAFALIEAWRGEDDVILIDSVVTGAPAGTVHIWKELPSLGSLPTQPSSHGFGVAEAIGLARILGLLPARLCIYGIEGKDFSIGSNLSTKQMSAIDHVVRSILQQIPAEARASLLAKGR